MSKRRGAFGGAFAVVLLAVTLLPLAARGEGAAAAAARKQATEMYQAYVRGDLETFVGYMHPKVVDMMGGKQKALETIRKAQAALAAQGLTATKATVAPVQQLVEVAPAKLQVIIPADVMMSGKDAEVRQRSFLLGFSSDGGKAWKFVDTGSGGGDCGFNFAVGSTYLVFAHRQPTKGRLSTGICSRTSLASWAGESTAAASSRSSGVFGLS